MQNQGEHNRFSQGKEVNNVKLCDLKIGNDVVCEVTADYPLLFSVRPRLNKQWLREVMATAINGYFLRRRNKPSCEVIRA